jgi:copper chaperone CopZ
MLIEGELEDRGISGRCSYAKQTVEVESDDTEKTDTAVKQAVEAAGYRLGTA